MDLKGLTTAEVKERIAKGLTNKYASHKTKTYGEIIIENIFSLFNLITIFIIGFVIYFYFKNNDQRLLLDTIGIFFIAFTNTSIALIQEFKSKKALDKVNLLLKREVTVIRDSERMSIDQTDIVVDDVIEVSRGDQIVADGKVIFSRKLEIDESLLTGESVPIEKNVNDNVLSGSFCVSGTGFYVAEKIGIESHANQVTNLAKKYKFTLTPLQKRINLILKVLFGIALVLVAIEVITYNVSAVKEYTFVDHIRKIATILISLVPQGLVLTASVTFAVGVFRISRIGAIIQKLNAIESFSNVEYVCMDKTGTLTENKLRIHSITSLNNSLSKEQIETLLGTFAKHSTEQNATVRTMEQLPFVENSAYSDEIPFSSDTKMSLLELIIDNQKRLFIFGAYDILLDKLTTAERDNAMNLYLNGNLNIHRNLFFGEITGLNNLNEFKTNPGIKIIPICILSISDTIREDVFEAIELFKSNGIKFKILTGDSPEAVTAILNDIGWKVEDNEILTGSQLEIMNESEFSNAVFNKTLFARLKPEHKLKIIKTFRKHHRHTAMIGDGVNDLPAIKSADIGIAMEEGSSITKEVADIVLLKNKFSLLPQIFNEGNKIVNSVNSIAKLFLTKNFLVIYLTLASLLSIMDFPLTPRRVSLLNVFSIGLPAFIITMRNQNINKCKNFVTDVFSFVITASTFMLLSSFIAQVTASIFLKAPQVELDMAVMIVLIIISVINFFIVISESQEKKGFYYLYGIFLLILFFFLSAVNLDFYILNILRTFYEIIFLDFRTWIFVLASTAILASIYVILQKLRSRIVKTK